MTGYSPEKILARRAQIAVCLSNGMSESATAREVGCSRMTVRAVHKTLPPAEGVQRIVQSADKAPESVQSVVQVAKPAPKPAHSFHSGETVLHEGVWRYITAVHLSAQTLNLRQVTGMAWEQTNVPFASVKPL